MSKFKIKNGVRIRQINGSSFSKNWMRFFYKNTKREVLSWNATVSENNKLHMKRDFKSVKKYLIKKIEDCGLSSKEELNALFLLTMKWTDVLKHRAMTTKEIKEVEKRILELNISVDVINPILKELCREDNIFKNLTTALLNKIENKVSESELRIDYLKTKTYIEPERNHKDLIIYEIATLLSKKTKNERSLKKSRSTTGEILEFIFSEKAPKNGWAPAIATAINRHNKKIKKN